ncbi:C-type lectin domain-containing protein [Eudoraea sp.]|uniref:C-type lectin domain-containing protein n=1 Tax=Eudoraea sp. TaxID=1979955 RepID=UPI003C71BEC7
MRGLGNLKLYLFIICLFGFVVFLQGQDILWSEDFSSYSNGTFSGTGSGLSPVNWNSDLSGRVNVNNNRIRARNTDAEGIWSTDPIDITNYTGINFSLDVDTMADASQFEDGTDYFIGEYRVNGVAWVQFENASGDTSPSDPLNTSYSVSVPSTGTTLELRIRFYNTANNEEYFIDNILVQGNLVVPNDPPVLTATGNQTYCMGTSQPIVETISITDTDDTTTSSVFIQISSGYVNGEDLLTLTGSHPNITASWDAVQGELSLTGPALYTEFETAVAAVEFSSSSLNPTGIRQFSITVGEANYLPPTGHYYEFVSFTGITWTAARDAAALRTYYGLQGYLATLTSQEEADFSGSQTTGVGWIGASDAATEGDWQWVTGPEAGTSFWSGGVGGTELTFAFWNNNEPNDYPDGPTTPGEENYAHITDPSVTTQPGSWNDLPNAGGGGAYAPQGYVVEYGGTNGDPVLSITATTTLNMDTEDPTASNPVGVTVYCNSDIPAADISVVIDEADNCTVNPTVGFISDVSNGGSNPELITRTYRVSDAAGNTTDVTQIITVLDVTIDTPPGAQTVFVNDNGIFTAATTNADTYQWQVSIDGGTLFTDISDGLEYSGSNTNTLTVIGTTLIKNGYLYRVLASNSSGSCPEITSASALLTVGLRSVITNRRITYRVDKS